MIISVAAGTLIAGFFDNAALFCRSIDLIDNLDKGKETPFCNITGERTSVMSLEGTFSHTQGPQRLTYKQHWFNTLAIAHE